METLHFDLTKEGNPIKLMNCTNGGPWHKRHANDQPGSNFAAYKAARIPYSRNHDSQMHGIYGGPYSHDITAIFPRFEADVNDPASYDFACTDESVLTCLEAGTKTFFRLGQSIEHQIIKHGTLPPKDFKKWAAVCEHIIRHYTEGWANGFTLDMPYWEIWNEPDLDPDDCANKRTWGGTEAVFFDFYAVAAKHLKQCFPHLRIGGPALAYNIGWAERFLAAMRERDVEIDFFSWHIYTADPKDIAEREGIIRGLLEKYGYQNAESILNEWNYIKGWTADFPESVRAIHGIKGAAFIAAVMAVSQASTMDMLMYYDTRPSKFNGLFDFYSAEPLKGYYPFLWYSYFYDAAREIPAENEIADIYPICCRTAEGKALAMITYYTNDDAAEPKEIALDFGEPGQYDLFLLDETHDGDCIKTADALTFTIAPDTCLFVKEK